MALPQTGNLTADTTGLIIQGKPSGRSSLPSTFAAFGTFGSGTIKLQAGFVNSQGVTTWLDIPNASFTANGAVNIAMKANFFRVVLSGSSGASIDWWFG
jgi:hypothetical protein